MPPAKPKSRGVPTYIFGVYDRRKDRRGGKQCQTVVGRLSRAGTPKRSMSKLNGFEGQRIEGGIYLPCVLVVLDAGAKAVVGRRSADRYVVSQRSARKAGGAGWCICATRGEII